MDVGEITMRAMAALDAKNRFGELLDAAQREPVSIEKRGRPVAVLMSRAEYDELQAFKFERLKDEVLKGVAQAEAGETVDGESVFADLRTRIENAKSS